MEKLRIAPATIPSYTMTLPVSGEVVKYRPFVVREEKILLIALQSNDVKQIIDAIRNIVLTCTHNQVDTKKISAADANYAMLQIRARSVGEEVKPVVKCSKCGGKTPIKINLERIQVTKKEKEELSPNIKINEDVTLIMRFPTIHDLDVTKDKTHPFVVNADNLNVRVLGTHFNVSNYPEDKMTDVVLVEGSVGLYKVNEKFNAEKNTVLKPGFKGSFSKTDNQIKTKAVVTDVYTAWIKGGLTFRDMTFKDISKKLERHYNVTIVNQNTKLSDEKFNASFGDEPIAKVLSYFNEIHGINYTLKNNEVLIK